MNKNEEMDLEIKSESPKPDKQKQLEEIIEKNTDKVVDILRKRDYEVIEPSQKAEPAEVSQIRKKSSKEGKTRVIGFSGKGGVGKTTLAALFLRIAIENKDTRAILAVDSDPNTCLPEVLGVKRYETLSSMIEGYKGGRLPPRKFKQEFNSLLLRNEQESYDLLPMGKSEGQGCYCSVNNLLRSAFHEFVLKGDYSYDYVIMDCEAGIEHISRKTSSFLNDLVIVTDDSQMSLNTVKKIQDTAQEVEIKIDKTYIIANRVENGKTLEKIRNLTREHGMTFLGSIPEDEEIKRLNLEGKSIFKLPEDSQAYKEMKTIAAKILI